jgi:hypothetical protein
MRSYSLTCINLLLTDLPSLKRALTLASLTTPKTLPRPPSYFVPRQMDTASEQQSSVRSLFAEADSLRRRLSIYPDSNSVEYQDNLWTSIAKYEQCKNVIHQASLFSLNESLEDVATSDMRYVGRSMWDAEV